MIWPAASRGLSFCLSLRTVDHHRVARRSRSDRTKRNYFFWSTLFPAPVRLPFFRPALHHLGNGKRHYQKAQYHGSPIRLRMSKQPVYPVSKDQDASCQAEPLQRSTHHFTS